MEVGNTEYQDCYFCAATGEVWIGEILGECPKCEGKKLVICGESSDRKECTNHVN